MILRYYINRLKKFITDDVSGGAKIEKLKSNSSPASDINIRPSVFISYWWFFNYLQLIKKNISLTLSTLVFTMKDEFEELLRFTLSSLISSSPSFFTVCRTIDTIAILRFIRSMKFIAKPQNAIYHSIVLSNKSHHIIIIT